jgi:hypothetical protein
MLRVSIHAGPLAGISPFNRLAWLDIAYERLAPVADYKTLLFTTGKGATPMRVLKDYPRWSASLWDLTARALALCLAPDANPAEESVPPFEPGIKHVAFATAVSILVEHYPGGNEIRRRTLASAEILKLPRKRGIYRARFEEDALPKRQTAPFTYAPAWFCPAQLVMRAALVHLTGQQEVMPPRPALAVPPPIVENEVAFVPVHRLPEPTRTGFLRWLERNSEPPLEHKDAPQGIVPEAIYATFLRKAI